MPTSAPSGPAMTPVVAGAGVELPAVVSFSQPCLRCGYDLLGLAGSGECPECGAAVARSLMGDLLGLGDPAYVGRLHLGVFLIQASIVAYSFSLVAGVAVQVMSSLGLGRLRIGVGAARLGGVLGAVVVTIGVLAEAGSVVGWWLFSVPDAGAVSADRGDRPRRVVRTMVVVSAVVMVATWAIRAAEWWRPGVAGGGVVGVAGVAGVVGLGAWVVKVIAGVRYARWLAPRLPNMRVRERAGALTWQLPLLWTVGAVACGVGPVAAMVLYYALLETIRSDLKAAHGSALALDRGEGPGDGA